MRTIVAALALASVVAAASAQRYGQEHLLRHVQWLCLSHRINTMYIAAVTDGKTNAARWG